MCQVRQSSVNWRSVSVKGEEIVIQSGFLYLTRLGENGGDWIIIIDPLVHSRAVQWC